MTHLSIPKENDVAVAINAGARVMLVWLANLYHKYVESNSYAWAAITYLLNLISSTIFADKALIIKT